MFLMLNLDDYGLPAIFAVSVVAILGASEIGRLLGARDASRGGEDVSTLEAATLGLLALMIGFTFAMSLGRFEARREAVLMEANTIGTAALRARLLPEPYKAESLKLMGEYVDFRLDIARRVLSLAELKGAIGRSDEIQESLWRHAMTLASKDTGMVPTGLYIQSLNEMIDAQGKRLAAVYSRVPNIVLIALYVVAIVALIFAGYANGLQHRRLRLPVYVMGVLIAAVILLIEDLDRPNTGFIKVSQQPMINTAASIAAYGD